MTSQRLLDNRVDRLPTSRRCAGPVVGVLTRSISLVRLGTVDLRRVSEGASSLDNQRDHRDPVAPSDASCSSKQGKRTCTGIPAREITVALRATTSCRGNIQSEHRTRRAVDRHRHRARRTRQREKKARCKRRSFWNERAIIL